MKVLLDEDLPHLLRKLLKGHDVSTAVYMGWGSLRNGQLLKELERVGFEVFVTCDKGLPNQQNVQGLSFGVVVLSAQEISLIEAHSPAIQMAVDAALPGSVQFVQCGNFKR